MKPKVFIGSSREALRAAEAAQRELSPHLSEAILWSPSSVTPTSPIEDLMNAVNKFDFAVFIFLPEDYVEIRGEKVLSIRDNVLFELGLFLGKLGRQRNFFLAPEGSGKLKFHLPSDLTGIAPSKYDSEASNLQAAVAIALHQFKEALRTLGTLVHNETILYDSQSDFKPYHFEHSNGFMWKDDKPVTLRGEGVFATLPGQVLKITRTNTEGRNEIKLLPNGPDKPSIPREHDVSFRVLHIVSEAMVEGGEHTLRFVAKDLTTRKWADSKTRKITATDWAGVDVCLQVPSTSDLLFRIDDESVAVAPSSVLIRGLKITEEH